MAEKWNPGAFVKAFNAGFGDWPGLPKGFARAQYKGDGRFRIFLGCRDADFEPDGTSSGGGGAVSCRWTVIDQGEG